MWLQISWGSIVKKKSQCVNFSQIYNKICEWKISNGLHCITRPVKFRLWQMAVGIHAISRNCGKNGNSSWWQNKQFGNERKFALKSSWTEKWILPTDVAKSGWNARGLSEGRMLYNDLWSAEHLSRILSISVWLTFLITHMRMAVTSLVWQVVESHLEKGHLPKAISTHMSPTSSLTSKETWHHMIKSLGLSSSD